MTSFRQIEANRNNAIRSTGPRTEAGKRQSRRNAIRHGLCAETVVEIIEDVDDYKGFEAAIIGDYDARTAVQRELVLRLASLLWRLRRATLIETELLRIQAEILRDGSHVPSRPQPQDMSSLSDITAHSRRCRDTSIKGNDNVARHVDQDSLDVYCHAPLPFSASRQLALSFQRLVDRDNAAFERLGRYESALSRQVLKILFLLRSERIQ